jgi:hypothetical protein
MATFQQVLAVNTQFLRQVQGRYALGNALQDAHDHTAAVMGALPEGSGERVVDTTAATAKVQHRRPIVPMHFRLFDRPLTRRATQTLGW